MTILGEFIFVLKKREVVLFLGWGVLWKIFETPGIFNENPGISIENHGFQSKNPVFQIRFLGVSHTEL